MFDAIREILVVHCYQGYEIIVSCEVKNLSCASDHKSFSGTTFNGL